MSDIKIVDYGGNVYQVTVSGGYSTTVHEVTADAATLQKLDVANINQSELVRQSFIFLLAREPNTSILQRFDLSVISRYFPEYTQTMRQLFSGKS